MLPRRYSSADNPYRDVKQTNAGFTLQNSDAFGDACSGGWGKVRSRGRKGRVLGSAAPALLRRRSSAAARAAVLSQVLCALGGRPATAGCSYTWRGTAPGEPSAPQARLGWALLHAVQPSVPGWTDRAGQPAHLGRLQPSLILAPPLAAPPTACLDACEPGETLLAKDMLSRAAASAWDLACSLLACLELSVCMPAPCAALPLTHPGGHLWLVRRFGDGDPCMSGVGKMVRRTLRVEALLACRLPPGSRGGSQTVHILPTPAAVRALQSGDSGPE